MKITEEDRIIIDNDMHFKQWFGHGDMIIDVGARSGDHAVLFAQIVGETGLVYAFEPNYETFECLLHNTCNYSQVKCFNFGLSNTEGYFGHVRCSNIGLSYLEIPGNGLQARIKSLDSLIDLFSFEKIKFIKIDIENEKIKVLEGATKIIALYRPIIMLTIAINNQAKKLEDIYTWLKVSGYNLFLNKNIYEIWKAI